MPKNNATKKPSAPSSAESNDKSESAGKLSAADSKTKVEDAARREVLQMRGKEEANAKLKEQVHVLKEGFVCDTDTRGYATPQGRSELDIVVNVSEGFVSLWAPETTLYWRFNEASMNVFSNPTAAKNELRQMLGEALLEWRDAAPVRFKEQQTGVWDFEIVMSPSDNCNPMGCTLARAFFPDPGRHRLTFFPILFEQSREEQIDTITHEVGHIFGLRHFFAPVSETLAPSVVFGTHNKFSIMNYGELSTLTDADRYDLKDLYLRAWSGQLTQINGTPIRFMRPYHTFVSSPNSAFAFASPPVPLGFHPGSEPLV